MNKINLQTIGTDAEMFLRNIKTGEIISAEGLIKGSKYDPYCFDPKEKWFTTSLDNVLAEITIPPATSMDQFSDGIIKAMDYVRSILPKGVEPVAIASANLADKYLMTEQAMQFGCEPDFNAYTGRMNEKPYCEDYSLRSAGLHLHAGFDTVEVPFNGDIFGYGVDEQRANIVKALDLFVSVPLVIVEPDSKRKELYGKAGAYRPKIYGLEYRSPSNFLLSSRELMNWGYSNVVNAFKYLNENGTLPDGLTTHVQSVINDNNKKDASILVSEFNLSLV